MTDNFNSLPEDDFKVLVEKLSTLPEVEAIALGGSRATERFDEKSDYDLYVYISSVPEEASRMNILKSCCSYVEAGNSFWELEDDCTLNNGIDIDILYRNPADFENGLRAVVDQGQAFNGYSTCMWYNLLHSTILYDKSGWYSRIQSEFDKPYPQTLQQNIIERNRRLLTGNLPSYDRQIAKAASRQDLTSINHRTAAYLESYFDILFALNALPHPGEKRMIQNLLDEAKLLPADFKENLDGLFENLFADSAKALAILQRMTDSLQTLLAENGFNS